MLGPSFQEILEEKLHPKTSVVREPKTSVVRQPKTQEVNETREGPYAVRASVIDTFFDPNFSPANACRADGKGILRRVYPQRPRTPRVKSPAATIAVQQLSENGREALKVLGIHASSISQTEVRRAFVRLARQFHPDAADDKIWQVQKETYLRAQEAYDVVMREVTKLVQDVRRAQSKPSSRDPAAGI